MDERRQFARTKLACPITIQDRSGRCLARTRSLDLSDAAIFAPIPIDAIPACGEEVTVQFHVPRATENTYMLEEFVAEAEVVRHQPMKEHDLAGVAMRFKKPLRLGL